MVQAALEKVRADKLREVLDGHDGTWIAHPALLPIAKQVCTPDEPHASPHTSRCTRGLAIFWPHTTLSLFHVRPLSSLLVPR